MSTFREPVVLRFESLQCCACSVWFAMDGAFYDDALRLKSQRSFYCPNGHSQRFIGKRPEELLREENNRLQSRLLETQSQKEAADRKLKRAEKRIHNGVCIHCNRSFSNLLRHMDSKHADQKKTT